MATDGGIHKMEFSSIAEMGAVVEGWRSYNEFWTILSSMGIPYIPFIIMLLGNWISAARNGDVLSSLRPMEIDIYGGVLIYALCLVPSVPLTGTVGPQSAEPVNIPVAWWFLHTYEQRLNKLMIERMAASAGAGSEPHQNLVRGMAQLAHLGIRSETLRAEVRHFEQDCYLPALGKFQTDQPPGAEDADVQWMGSHWFLTHPGYYLRCDTEACYESGAPRSGVASFGGGRPTCTEWWEGGSGGEGLKSRLVDEAMDNPQLDVGNLGYLANRFGLSGTEGEDTLARAALSSVPSMRNIVRQEEGADVSQWLAIGIGAGGLAFFETFVFAPMMQIVGYGLPYLQSVVTYWFLFGLVFAQLLSFYAPQAIFALAITYATIAFWPVMFEANYRLVEKLTWWVFPDGEILDFHALDSMAFTLTLGLSTFISLMIFTTLMGIVGYKGAAGIDKSINEVKSSSESAGKKRATPSS